MLLEKLQKQALRTNIIGGAAVIITLVILVSQVRNNTATIKVPAYDEFIAANQY